jgi:hypothetical protein
VRVDSHRQADLRVPQRLHHDPGVDALYQQQPVSRR